MNKLLLVALCCLVAVLNAKMPPKWPSSYWTKGNFSLHPQMSHSLNYELVMYHDTTLGTYIQYDNGIEVVVQNLKEKKTWMVVAADKATKCYTTKNGGGPSVLSALEASNGEAVTLQPAMPDLANYTFIEMVACPRNTSRLCENWQLSEYITGKLNWYSVIVDTTNPMLPRPERFEFIGHDFLFGSHNDHYIFEYNGFLAPYHNGNLVKKPIGCAGNEEEATHDVQPQNPALKVIHTPAHTEFRQFIKTHQKTYDSQKEYDTRLTNFHRNLGLVNQHNADPSQTYKMKLNHMSDLTREERKHRFGQLGAWSPNPQHVLGTFKNPGGPMPQEVNWRLKGAVTNIKDQGVCGSCWSFGATGALESAEYITNGHLPYLSQQFIVDCCWNEGNQGCQGGFSNAAYDCIKNYGGIPTEQVYGQYMMINTFCHANASMPLAVKITGYVNITSGSIKDTAAAVATAGPLAISIDAALDSFGFYSHGVYSDPKCLNGINDLDHSVLLVGYGTEDGKDYWLVRNQWSHWWGADGYIKIAKDSRNICGVATAAMYPKVVPRKK
eukprot:TRINITY_DN12217_c0_g1_i1.p1 TRINITY_DN12217_c0_g1~~TRINITY_DN12217_c0_g1_i1.p1  ORF type:complete len:553 (+),score=105.88 TRINITY_DN12217_c0_g1_i1:24-1682(+)